MHILVCASIWIEWREVHSSWRKHGQLQIVRVDPLIVLGEQPLQSDAVGVLIVLLVGLLRPWKEKAARAAVLQAIRWRAAVQVELGLDSACQCCDAKALEVIPAP